MYQIKVDGNILYDPRDAQLTLTSPKCKLAVNTVGEASFVIHATHPHFMLEESQQMHKLRSIFEILQDGTPIFRGRMTDDSRDFNNSKSVDLEGVLGFFNDSVIPPFVFPDDANFQADADFKAAKAETPAQAALDGGVVRYLLQWFIEQHNSQVEPFQQFQLGRVTVSDKNNVIVRSLEDYTTTWEVLKTRLVESGLGGYLCIRYEYDENGNPINIVDYLSDFTNDDGEKVVNKQKISFGENLTDLVHDSDATATYSAVIPLGKKGENSPRLTIKDLPNRVLQETPEGGKIIKNGIMIYSEKAVEQYGFIIAPPSDTTWDDIESDTNQLQSNGVDFLVNTAMQLFNTITAMAVDLHFSNEQIEALRIYSYIQVESKPHGLDALYKLEQLEIDIPNPQNTVITIGDTQLSMTDINASIKKNVATQAETIKDTVKTQLNESIAEMDYVETDTFERYQRTVSQQMNTMSQDIESLSDEVESLSGAGEWMLLEMSGDFGLSADNPENQPKYKASKNIVTVTGAVSPKAESASNNAVVIASGIPANYCPSTDQQFVCQGTGMNRWTCTIKTDGTITMSNYGTTDATTVPTSACLNFSCTYQV